MARHWASDNQCLPSTHSRQNKHSTDADGDSGRSTLARERHAVRHITRPTSKETKTDRHNVFIRLFIKLTHYFRYAARQFAIWISTGTYDIPFIIYHFTSLTGSERHKINRIHIALMHSYLNIRAVGQIVR